MYGGEGGKTTNVNSVEIFCFFVPGYLCSSVRFDTILQPPFVTSGSGTIGSLAFMSQ